MLLDDSLSRLKNVIFADRVRGGARRLALVRIRLLSLRLVRLLCEYDFWLRRLLNPVSLGPPRRFGRLLSRLEWFLFGRLLLLGESSLDLLVQVLIVRISPESLLLRVRIPEARDGLGSILDRWIFPHASIAILLWPLRLDCLLLSLIKIWPERVRYHIILRLYLLELFDLLLSLMVVFVKFVVPLHCGLELRDFRILRSS